MDAFTAPINYAPPGLLDALGIKTFGRNPTILSEQLLPTLDMTNWYLETQQERLRDSTVTIVANGNSVTTIIVPAGEVWLVWDSSVTLTSTTGTGIISPYWSVPGPTGNIVREGTSQAVAAAETRIVQLNRRPFFLPPASSMQVTASNYAGAGQIGVTAFAAITRLAY